MAEEVKKDDQKTKEKKEAPVSAKREVGSDKEPTKREATFEGTRPKRTGAPHEAEEGQGQRRIYFRKKVCKLCVNKVKSVDYKDVNLLRKFITDRGKILPRRITGTCARHQRMLSRTIKRSRMIALLPFVSK